MAPTDDFDKRLAQARGQDGGARNSDGQPSPLGSALRIGTELVAGVAVGGFIGWLLDQWLGTRWLLFVFLGLGIAAGFTNVFRAARKLNDAAGQAVNLPAVPDDDDD